MTRTHFIAHFGMIGLVLLPLTGCPVPETPVVPETGVEVVPPVPPEPAAPDGGGEVVVPPDAAGVDVVSPQDAAEGDPGVEGDGEVGE